MHEGFDGDVVELTTGVSTIHVFFEVFVHVLEDEHELVLGVNDIVEGDDILVFEFFHERDFANGGARSTFLAVEMYFFECDKLTSLSITTFEDLGGIRSV